GLAHVGAAHAGQHQVEQHDVGPVAVELLERLLAGVRDRGGEALLAQQESERVGEGLLVLDDEHPGQGSPPLLEPLSDPVEPLPEPLWAGMRSVNVEPVPGRLHSWTSPPWWAATCLTIASPSPVPPVARERALSNR